MTAVLQARAGGCDSHLENRGGPPSRERERPASMNTILFAACRAVMWTVLDRLWHVPAVLFCRMSRLKTTLWYVTLQTKVKYSFRGEVGAETHRSVLGSDVRVSPDRFSRVQSLTNGFG